MMVDVVDIVFKVKKPVLDYWNSGHRSTQRSGHSLQCAECKKRPILKEGKVDDYGRGHGARLQKFETEFYS
ncbi:hypothetical protein Sjap_011222 [Stephania japonica]|uniref:Uncharacterized protein n=1 Tax=Stephania japonica TaxID=461633 RepID=A0AAP0P784_9MAGN